MNGKKSKRIRKAAKIYLVSWLRSVLPESEHAAITVDNILTKLAKDKHMYADNQVRLIPYSYKWVCKRLKRNESLSNAG